MSREELAATREQIHESKIKDVNDSTASFFVRGAVLAGASLSLLIPFLQNVTETTSSLAIGEVGLLSSFTFSLVGFYLNGLGLIKRAGGKIFQLTEWKGLFPLVEFLKIACLLTYLIAICSIIYFVNSQIGLG